MWPFSSGWKSVVARKQAARTKALEDVSTANTKSFAPYLTASASEIVQAIEIGRWTASEVLEAYISRAALAQEKINCITEVLFEQARKEAHALDEYFQDTKKIKGPLHGVPVSFKDLFDIAGYDTTLGFTLDANKPATTDADLVRLVREAGGIPFVKTNVPQTMMFFECVNPMWGRTLNPYSKDHTCGGSSGGEAAILAMDGSALGWGTDVGGSLRIPASYCGIYSLKPGNGRVPIGGGRDNLPGFEAVRTVAGPMARSVADIELASRVTFGKPSLNYEPAPIPYRDVKLPEKLKFGYYTSDCFVKASPVCQRAVLETVEALRRQGHECVEFQIPEPSRPMELLMSLISSDGNKTLFAPIGPDPQVAELATVALGPKLFNWLKSFLGWVITNAFGDYMFANILRVSGKKSVHEFWQVTNQAKELSRNFYQEVWEKHQFDGIIAPAQAMPALPHGSVALIAALACSTIQYNIVDSPVGIVPVTRVNPKLDAVTEEWSDHTVGEGHGSPLLERLLYKGSGAFYNAEKMAGLPVGVQVVGKKWEEEKVIEMMKVVDGALGSRGFGPGAWKAE